MDQNTDISYPVGGKIYPVGNKSISQVEGNSRQCSVLEAKERLFQRGNDKQHQRPVSRGLQRRATKVSIGSNQSEHMDSLTTVLR